MSRLRRVVPDKALALLGLLAITFGASAQEAPASYARIVVINPHAGENAKFVEGYEKHIQWHKDNKDPWTWYGWTVVLGPRLGHFMDGTFGHRLKDFDTPIKPAEDAADNNLNVTPHADFASHGLYERIDRLGKGPALPDTSPYLVLDTYQVKLGEDRKFEASVQGLKDSRYTLYKQKLGSNGSVYLLFRSAQKFSEAGMVSELDLQPGIVESHINELWRYQPRMSHIP